MSHKQNIDIYFREVFASDGPEISVLDEEQFLQSMRDLNKEKKRRRAFFIWGFGCIVLGLAMAGVSQMRVFSGSRTIFHTAKTEQNTLYSESKTGTHSSEINTQNQNKISQIKPEEVRSFSPKKEKHNYPRKVYATGTETINMPPYADEIVAIIVQEKITEFEAKEIKMQGLKIVNLTLSANKTLKEPEFAKIKHAKNGLQVSASSGFANMQGRWAAKSNEKSHQDMASITEGMKTKGNGIVNGISLGYALGRFTFGMGLTQQMIQTHTLYNRKVENVPVIDSASGNIKGYLNLGAGKEYEIQATSAVFTQYQLPVFMSYKVFNGSRSNIELCAGLALNFANRSNMQPFDLNTMRASTASPVYSKINLQYGVNYFYKPGSKWAFGLQLRSQTNTADFAMRFGSSALKYSVFSIAPCVRINLN